LDQFQIGSVYEVSVSLACYLLAMEAVELVTDESPALVLPRHKLMFSPNKEPAEPKPVSPPARADAAPLAEAADRPPKRRRTDREGSS
jgi:hypothetical protein